MRIIMAATLILSLVAVWVRDVEIKHLKGNVDGVSRCYFEYTKIAQRKLDDACDTNKILKTQIRQLQRYAEQGTKEELLDAFRLVINSN